MFTAHLSQVSYPCLPPTFHRLVISVYRPAKRYGYLKVMAFYNLYTLGSVTHYMNRLVGLVVKVSASRAEDPGFESRLRRDSSGSSHTSHLNIGTPVGTLPSARRYRVSAGTGQPGVSIL